MALSVTNYYNIKKKYNYREHARVEQRTWDEIDKFLNLHQIKFSGFDLPKPIFYLDEINFPDYITDELRMQGILRPTAIQSMTWPALYSGRDIMCIGLPTSSRVISYICPALVFVKEQSIEVRKSGPLVLIATQTKEVAKEILTQSQMFIHQANCTYCCLFDDENIGTQALHLREHEPDIIIGNYHRLCEMLDNDLVNLKNVAFLVMDDFYRNRSARLSDEIKRVVNETRSERQTAIFSRIVPSGLQKSNGDEFQNDAVFVCIGNDDIHVSHKELPQTIHICTMAEKKKKLQDLITEIKEKENNFKILVYANGFKKIRITEKIIKELGIDTFAYERTNVGKRRRAMKEKVYYNFNATPNSVLVASDVVSSKVELPDLNYIINADFPVNLSLYLNRMRMPNVKKYISIFIAEDARHADRLIYVLNECKQVVPTILYKISEAYTNSGKDVDRMPSLQEINDGLTKPVEKPIPKPLPPTVCLETNSSLKAKRTLEDKLKTQTQIDQLESTRIDEHQPTTEALNLQTESIADNPTNENSNNTTIEITTTNGNREETPINPIAHLASSSSSSLASLSPNEASSSSSSSISSLNSNHSSKASSHSSSSSGYNSSSTSNNSTPFKRFKSSSHLNGQHHPRPPLSYVNFNQNKSTIYNHLSSSPMHFNNHHYANMQVHHQSNPYSQVPGYYMPVASTPQQVQLNSIYNSYQTNQSYYQQTQPQQIAPNYYQNPSVYTNHSHQFMPNIHQLQQQQQQHEAYLYHQQIQQQRQNEILLQQQTQQQHQQSQYNQQYYNQVSQQQQMQSVVKSEPHDPQNNSLFENKPNESSHNPYFTNPIPFKQEPKEEPIDNNGQNNDDSNGLKIVSKLLNDKQVLNQLERVAQSFRLS